MWLCCFRFSCAHAPLKLGQTSVPITSSLLLLGCMNKMQLRVLPKFRDPCINSYQCSIPPTRCAAWIYVGVLLGTNVDPLLGPLRMAVSS